MRNSKTNSKTMKKALNKCKRFIAYNEVQWAYADTLATNEDIVTRKGLIVNKLRYRALGYVDKFLKGGKCVVAYNPFNVSVVYLLENGEYVKFELIEKFFEEKSFEEANKIKKQKKDIIKQYSETALISEMKMGAAIDSFIQNKKPQKINTKSVRQNRKNEITNEDFKSLLDNKYGMQNLIEQHTLVSFYSSFFTSTQKKLVLQKAMNCEPCITHFLSYPTTHMRTIKYCPKCISEHREPYFALEPQIIGMNYCPIHKCKYRSTNILLDREKLLEFKSMDLIDFDLSPIEQSEEDNINIKVARYISEFLHSEPNYDNNIPIGLFLRSRLEGTDYISKRGKQIKNLNQLLFDITDFYKDLEYFELSRWRLCHILMGSYINVYDILLIAYFLQINIQDVINPILPHQSQLELFDMKVNEMFRKGMNYMDIARALKTDKEVIRQVILGKYIKQNL